MYRKALLSFSLPITTFIEGEFAIAHTPALDLSVQGKNVEEAIQRLVEGVNILFEELEEEGTTEEVLSELGWKKSNHNWEPPEVTLINKTVEVPIKV
jgi:predicted RNase H-like HicB family nuclease